MAKVNLTKREMLAVCIAIENSIRWNLDLIESYSTTTAGKTRPLRRFARRVKQAKAEIERSRNVKEKIERSLTCGRSSLYKDSEPRS